jgi:hypothetical protein
MNRYKLFIIESFESNDQNVSKINILFSHTSGLLPFYANMGIGKDVNNFNYTNIEIENRNRSYRVSQMDPMNTNMAFVLYNCENNNNNNNDTANSSSSNYILRAFLNEQLVKLDMCQSKDCTLDEFQAYMASRIGNCVSTRQVCSLD